MLDGNLMHSRLIRPKFFLCFVCLLIANVAPVVTSAQMRSRDQKTPTRKAVDSKPLVNQTITQGGVSVTFSIQPITATGPVKGQLIEATEATVRFEITDTTSRKPLTNLRPVAWIDARGESAPLEARGCREKVQTLLQSNFAEKADVDLNSYFILTLNHEPNISVIDPFSSVGPTRLYTLVALRSPGEDWVLTANQKRLFVSLPQVNQVAVVDTSTWQVIANIDAGIKPSRLALQHDERYLWVGNDSAEALGSGVTVIDTTTLKVSARITTGAGHHEIGFTENDRYAFVTNKEEGTLSIFDVHKLAKLKDLPIGLKPTALTFSSLSKTVYVANEGDGNIVAVDGTSHAILTRITMQPGLHAMRLTPDDRYGFVTNIANDTVSIFDVSTNRFLQRVPVGPGPDQLAFTRDFAYVRSSKSEFVTMINVNRLGQEGNELSLTRFPSGQKAPRESPYSSLAAMLVPAPEQGAVLVANAADKMIYFYTEGMAAPMGSFQNYKRDPRALLVLDNSLRETGPGIYTTTVKLPAHGHYDIPFLLDSPRLVNCFDLRVAENPASPKNEAVALWLEPLSIPDAIKVGETYQLRIKVTDARSKKPAIKLEDLGALVFLSPGIWQQRMSAREVGDGVYEISFKPPEPGVYYVFFQCPSLGVRFTQLPSINLEATNSTGTGTTQP
jgi:YVTN family beta-propeller protein